MVLGKEQDLKGRDSGKINLQMNSKGEIELEAAKNLEPQIEVGLGWGSGQR